MSQDLGRPMPETVDIPTLVHMPAIETKYVACGETLEEVALQFDLYSAYLRRLAARGWTLDYVSDQGVVHLITPQGQVACQQCGSLQSKDRARCDECGAGR